MVRGYGWVLLEVGSRRRNIITIKNIIIVIKNTTIKNIIIVIRNITIVINNIILILILILIINNIINKREKWY